MVFVIGRHVHMFVSDICPYVHIQICFTRYLRNGASWSETELDLGLKALQAIESLFVFLFFSSKNCFNIYFSVFFCVFFKWKMVFVSEGPQGLQACKFSLHPTQTIKLFPPPLSHLTSPNQSLLPPFYFMFTLQP